MSKLLLKGGRVVDPASKVDGKLDILVSNKGTIIRIGKNLREPGARVLDCKGRVVCPGFIDMHVHLREPGQEYKETVESGSRAAVAGGFTGIACMANTVPPNDCAAVTESIHRAAREGGHCHVHPIAAVTKGMEGKELTEFGDLKRAGAVAFSDDGLPITDHGLMRKALEYGSMFDMPIIDHAEEPTLAVDGQLNEGWMSTRLGLPGIAAVAEELHVARDVMLSHLTGGSVHIAHLSTARSVDLVRQGKKAGAFVTCEVAPHHFLLDESALEGFNTHCKMKPPLRTKNDVKALLKGLRDGTVDCIATDHAPHHSDEKEVPYEDAAFGIVGLETAVALSIDRLLHGKVVDLTRLVELLSWNPARILGVPGGTLAVGATADITVLDLDLESTVTPSEFESKGKNTPFGDAELKGRAVATIVGGRVAWTVEGGIPRR